MQPWMRGCHVSVQQCIYRERTVYYDQLMRCGSSETIVGLCTADAMKTAFGQLAESPSPTKLQATQSTSAKQVRRRMKRPEQRELPTARLCSGVQGPGSKQLRVKSLALFVTR
eukprot:6202659-Pleurochrysis_carterae.AAC.5